MSRLYRILIGVGLLGSLAAGSGPTARDRALVRSLDQILGNSQFQQGFWGVYVYSLDRKRVLYNSNGDHWFTPASNAKLFTLAAALHLLGPDFRFHTAMQSSAPPDPSGVITGDLALIGVGDPSISGRHYPYRNDPPAPALPYDPEAVPRALAQQLVIRGVKRIAGDIIGDDSYFRNDPYPDGWTIGDTLWDYGAPVSALSVNDNTRFLQIVPAAVPGAPPNLRWSPALLPPNLRNLATTLPAGSRTRLRLQQDAASGDWNLTGGIAAGSAGELEALAVRDPALYAAQLLRQALLDAGIAVSGSARAQHDVPSVRGFELGAWDSPPLAELLQATAKVSQNLEAEMMLRVLGKLRGSAPPGAPAVAEAASGAVVVRTFLHNAGLAATDAALNDGSGLSRLDLVTPAGVVRLLRYMRQQPEAQAWQALLPVAGVDGTLEHRFVHTAAAGKLEAKTGSLSHVNSLSGYVVTRHGETLAFSLLSNNVDRPAAEARAQLDRIANALSAW